MSAPDEFEGRDVVSTQLIVTGTGDGLSKALQVKPTMIHHGDHVYLLIKAAGHKVRFDPHKDDPEQLVRVQILRAETVAIVSAEFAMESIEAQRKAEDAALGRVSLPFQEAGDAAMVPSGELLVEDGNGVVLTEAEVLERRAGEERDAAAFFGQPAEPSIEDLPTTGDLAEMRDSSIKQAVEFVSFVDDVASARRLLVAEKQTHDGRGRKSVVAALANRIAQLELGDL